MWVVHIAKALAIAFLIIRIVTDHLSKSSYITSHHLVVDSGLFSIDEDIYELHQLRRIKIHQNALGRRLGYGNLEVHFGARGFEKTITLSYIASPRKFEELLEQHLKD